ncbi:hypothetical protein F503_04883 [Ophiostoma piceae UAMH 11346]|uniref:Uncharacterized protein n=1 Tax=Ophiostoma piceae (strain UAMH 11346) TaxID=1262450 RepID=S3CTL0_OPHP1|nr:hypothetical protein F503_04883 [Ophiostoma piceae UAMH 11346]
MPTSTTTLTTTNPSHSLVLVDYELHRSSPPPAEPHGEQRIVEQSRVSNPPDWPADHRRVPAYRPVNTNLNPEDRIVFNNRGEQMFIRTMFFGIQVVTAFHRTWTMTAGKLNNGKTFCYELGGEY